MAIEAFLPSFDTQNDSALSLSETSSKARDRPPNLDLNICRCRECKCTFSRKEDNDMGVHDDDTASIQSSGSNDMVKGQEGVENEYEGPARRRSSAHNYYSMERGVMVDPEDAWHALTLAEDTHSMSTSMSLSMSMSNSRDTLNSSMMNEPGDPDSMTHSAQSLPRPPSPGSGPYYIDAIGTCFGEATVAAIAESK